MICICALIVIILSFYFQSFYTIRNSNGFTAFGSRTNMHQVISLCITVLFLICRHISFCLCYTWHYCQSHTCIFRSFSFSICLKSFLCSHSSTCLELMYLDSCIFTWHPCFSIQIQQIPVFRYRNSNSANHFQGIHI